MQVNLVSFPGGSTPVTLLGPATLRQVLEHAEALPATGEAVDLSINGEITTDLDAVVPDGSTVLKTKRVAGG